MEGRREGPAHEAQGFPAEGDGRLGPDAHDPVPAAQEQEARGLGGVQIPPEVVEEPGEDLGIVVAGDGGDGEAVLEEAEDAGLEGGPGLEVAVVPLHDVAREHEEVRTFPDGAVDHEVPGGLGGQGAAGEGLHAGLAAQVDVGGAEDLHGGVRGSAIWGFLDCISGSGQPLR